MQDKDTPTDPLNDTVPPEFQEFVGIVSGYVDAANTLLSGGNAARSMIWTSRAIQACEEDPDAAFETGYIEILRQLAEKTVERVPGAYRIAAKAVLARILEFRRLGLH